MNINHLTTHTREFFTLFVLCFTVIFSNASFAWGRDGHATVGILAMEMLPVSTSAKLRGVLGSTDDQTMLKACNWPDAIRETEQWAWTYPLHYINIPQGEARYSKPRDCPDQLCATEGIKKYAAILADKQASQESRQQAFGWICHLTGDLHQPLHAGYAFDRGGNNFDIDFSGEQMNLHNFWDRALIQQRAGDWQHLVAVLRQSPAPPAGDNWTPAMVDRWTEESHQLVETEIYPESPEISQCYADRSWALLQRRINTAATHLALIIRTAL